jgi:hypothetical protein
MDESIVELRKELLRTTLALEERLAGLSEEELKRPAVWNGLNRNVRFLMHRLTAHVADHTLQVRKSRQAMGLAGTEAQGILGQFLVAEAGLVAETMGLSPADFERAPAEGEWSAKEILEHLVSSQQKALQTIEEALSAREQK